MSYSELCKYDCQLLGDSVQSHLGPPPTTASAHRGANGASLWRLDHRATYTPGMYKYANVRRHAHKRDP
jgi:hypothetical protein